MGTEDQILVFSLNERKYALPIALVSRVIPAIEITPLPGAHCLVLGAINVRGRLICVVDIRTYLRIPPREIELEDRLILLRSGGRVVAIPVDAVEVVAATKAQSIAGPTTRGPNSRIQGLLKDASGIVGICEVSELLELDCLSTRDHIEQKLEVTA